ncbi:MAG: periplasmic heavy metal sensor [Blastocatellia bacterium]
MILLFWLMLAIGVLSAVAQRFPAQAGGRVSAVLGQQVNRFPNQRRLNRPPFGNPRLGRRPGALPRNQEQKQLLQQRLMRAIGLTPQQQARIQQIRRGHDDEVIAAGRRLRQARRSLDLAIMSERYDEATVRRATDELAAAQADKIRLDSQIRAEVRSVLTPDQVTRFHQLERQMRQEMRQRNLEEREKETTEPTPPNTRPPLGNDEDELTDLISPRTRTVKEE